MSPQSPEHTKSSGNAEIIQFEDHLPDSSSRSVEYIIKKSFNSSEFKKALESAMLNSYFKYQFSNVGSGDDPFDAIYLSELEPDGINPSDVQRLVHFASTQDLSHTIEFDDDWED